MGSGLAIEGYSIYPNDWILDENNSRVYLAAVQEVEPPEITVTNWSFQPCSDRQLGDCANITLTLRDSGSGLKAVSAQHLGSGWTLSFNLPAFFTYIGQGGQDLHNLSYWIEMPISGVHDRLGTFKVFIEATDGVGNYNSTIFVGGGAYDSTKSSVEALAKKNATAPELLGWYSGWWYAKKSGLVDVPCFWDDLLAGRTSLKDIVDSLGAIPELVTHTGTHYDQAYLDYMRTLALSVNPYVPTLEDLTNLANDSLVFWMRDVGAQKVNASAWLKFAKAFWDGSVAGGIDTAVGTTLASMVLGGAMGAALRAIPIVARILGTIKLVMAAALTVIKTILQKVVSVAFKAVTLLAAKLWMATRAAASFASDALHGFVLRTAMRLGADGVAHRIMQAFAQRIHDFATWWGTTVERISDAMLGVADTITNNLRIMARLMAAEPNALGDAGKLAAMAERAGSFGSGARTLIKDVTYSGERLRVFLQDGREFRFKSFHGYDRHDFAQRGWSRDMVENEILDDIHMRGPNSGSFPQGVSKTYFTGPHQVRYDVIQYQPGKFDIPTYRPG